MMALDFQVLFGLLLYFGLSPLTKIGLENLSLAVSQPAIRFWTLSHFGAMVAATILVRVGASQAINAKTPGDRRTSGDSCSSPSRRRRFIIGIRGRECAQRKTSLQIRTE